MLRLLTLSLCLALPCANLRTQTSRTTDSRWEAGPSVLAGADVHVGGFVSRRLVQTGRIRVAAEVSAYLPLLGQREWACLNGSACANGFPPPEASSLLFAGVRSTLPLTPRWYAVADAAVVQGHWRQPTSGTHRALGAGVSLGYHARSERWGLEGRWQRIGTGDVPASIVRFGWHRRW